MIQDINNIKVAVICKNEQISEILEANFVGSFDLIEKIRNGWLDFDILMITPEMMSKVGPLAKVLGPAGKMPNIQNETIVSTSEINYMINYVRMFENNLIGREPDHLRNLAWYFWINRKDLHCGAFKSWFLYETAKQLDTNEEYTFN